MPTRLFQSIAGLRAAAEERALRVCVRSRDKGQSLPAPGGLRGDLPQVSRGKGLGTDPPHWQEEEYLSDEGGTAPPAAQRGGPAAKVCPEPQAQEPGKHTRAAASGLCRPVSRSGVGAQGTCSCPAEIGHRTHSVEHPLLCHHPKRAALSSRVSATPQEELLLLSALIC